MEVINLDLEDVAERREQARLNQIGKGCLRADSANDNPAHAMQSIGTKMLNLTREKRELEEKLKKAFLDLRDLREELKKIRSENPDKSPALIKDSVNTGLAWRNKLLQGENEELKRQIENLKASLEQKISSQDAPSVTQSDTGIVLRSNSNLSISIDPELFSNGHRPKLLVKTIEEMHDSKPVSCVVEIALQ